MKNKVCLAFALASVFFVSSLGQAQLPKIPANPVTGSKAPAPAAVAAAANPSPELVGQLTKDLKVTNEQATGGAGALFGLAKSRLKPEEFAKVAGAVPGMDGLLAAAPKSLGEASPLGGVASAIPGGVGGLAPVAGSFKSLGLSPDMAMQFIPVLTNYVGIKGGAEVASLLGSVLK